MPDWTVGGPNSLTRYAASGELAAVTATTAAGCQPARAARTSATGGALPVGAGPPPGIATGSPAPSAAAANGLVPGQSGGPELVQVPGNGTETAAADVGLAAGSRADEIAADDRLRLAGFGLPAHRGGQDVGRNRHDQDRCSRPAG